MKTAKKHTIILIISAVAVLLLIAAFFIYVSDYYHADSSVNEALVSDEYVTVTQTDYGWFFDGASVGSALVFYPGGKVEETAYAPFLHKLAHDGIDVCLVKMPLRLAIFDADKADLVMSQYDYEHWYIGGHSLGGSAAALYAANNEELLDGVILCAAYPVQKLDDDLTEIMIYGSEDKVLNAQRLAESMQYDSDDMAKHIINGGNHAQFGCYGVQAGDGTASVSAETQQAEAADFIIRTIETA